MAELIIIMMYVISEMIIGINMIVTGRYMGELRNFEIQIEILKVFVLLVITIISFFAIYIIYKATKNNKKYLTKKKWIVNVSKFNNVFSVFVISQILFFSITNVGRVGGIATSGISFIFAMLNIDAIIAPYYFLCRDTKNKRFILNIILYCTLKLLQGWTGFLLAIAMYELCFYFKKHKKITVVQILKTLTFPSVLILVGAKIYQYMYGYKFYIRSGIKIKLNYYEGLVNLVSRLSFFPIAVGAYERIDAVKLFYMSDNIVFKEIKGLFRPFLPRSIMPFKEFRSLNNNILQAFWYDITEKTSSNFGAVMYGKTLFKINWVEGLVWVILTVFLCSVFKKVFNSLEQYRGQLDFLYFLLLLRIYSVASLEIVFGYGYLQLFYIIPVLFMIGVIKFRKGGIYEN